MSNVIYTDTGMAALALRENKEGMPIMHSASFVSNFLPPDYVLDGVLQSRFIYSLTAPTGGGKTAICLRLAAHVALGRPMMDREVLQGRVLYLAGENPDDIRMRWIALAESMGFDPRRIDVDFVAGVFELPGLRMLADVFAKQSGGYTMIIVDTSAAYFTSEGAEGENGNSEMKAHAQTLRTLTEVRGEPCVIVACHPTKNARRVSDMVPRGGGAFLAEVDGNIAGDKSGNLVHFHRHDKFRGPDFDPLSFRLKTFQAEALKDRKGRQIMSVVAEPVAYAEVEKINVQLEPKDGDLLAVIIGKPELSIREYCEALGWIGQSGQAQKSSFQKSAKRLEKAGLISKDDQGRYSPTPDGLTAEIY